MSQAEQIKAEIDSNTAKIAKLERTISGLESDNKRLKELLAVEQTEPLPLFQTKEDK